MKDVKCGCVIERRKFGEYGISYCQLHQSASSLLDAAEWALRGLEQLAREEAVRCNTTFEMCDYTFALSN
jgi:hypothetical protein